MTELKRGRLAQGRPGPDLDRGGPARRRLTLEPLGGAQVRRLRATDETRWLHPRLAPARRSIPVTEVLRNGFGLLARRTDDGTAPPPGAAPPHPRCRRPPPQRDPVAPPVAPPVAQPAAPVAAPAPASAPPAAPAAAARAATAPPAPNLVLDDLLIHVLQRRRLRPAPDRRGAADRPRCAARWRCIEGYAAADAPSSCASALYGVMTERQRKVFEEELELDFAYAVPGHARFRVNVFQQRDSLGAVMRMIPWEILPLDELGMPDGRSRASPTSSAAWCWSPARPAPASRPRWPRSSTRSTAPGAATS